MVGLDDTAAAIAVRDDLREAHRALWEHVRAPGSWWTGSQRVAMVAESRAAEECLLCQTRKQALSPHAVLGQHQSRAALAEGAVDVVHRLRTDPGRLSRAWYDRALAN